MSELEGPLKQVLWKLFQSESFTPNDTRVNTKRLSEQGLKSVIKKLTAGAFPSVVPGPSVTASISLFQECCDSIRWVFRDGATIATNGETLTNHRLASLMVDDAFEAHCWQLMVAGNKVSSVNWTSFCNSFIAALRQCVEEESFLLAARQRQSANGSNRSRATESTTTPVREAAAVAARRATSPRAKSPDIIELALSPLAPVAVTQTLSSGAPHSRSADSVIEPCGPGGLRARTSMSECKLSACLTQASRSPPKCPSLQIVQTSVRPCIDSFERAPGMPVFMPSPSVAQPSKSSPPRRPARTGTTPSKTDNAPAGSSGHFFALNCLGEGRTSGQASSLPGCAPGALCAKTYSTVVLPSRRAALEHTMNFGESPVGPRRDVFASRSDPVDLLYDARYDRDVNMQFKKRAPGAVAEVERGLDLSELGLHYLPEQQQEPQLPSSRSVVRPHRHNEHRPWDDDSTTSWNDSCSSGGAMQNWLDAASPLPPPRRRPAVQTNEVRKSSTETKQSFAHIPEPRQFALSSAVTRSEDAPRPSGLGGHFINASLPSDKLDEPGHLKQRGEPARAPLLEVASKAMVSVTPRATVSLGQLFPQTTIDTKTSDAQQAPAVSMTSSCYVKADLTSPSTIMPWSNAALTPRNINAAIGSALHKAPPPPLSLPRSRSTSPSSSSKAMKPPTTRPKVSADGSRTSSTSL